MEIININVETLNNMNKEEFQKFLTALEKSGLFTVGKSDVTYRLVKKLNHYNTTQYCWDIRNIKERRIVSQSQWQNELPQALFIDMLRYL